MLEAASLQKRRKEALMQNAVVAVDVGTGSARAGVFTPAGHLLGAGRHDIALWKEGADLAEQSSADIWRAVRAAVRGALAACGPVTVAGLGFDATCSLVVADRAGAPVPVSPSGAPERDIIVWMDHRAVAETAAINATGHRLLRHVGGAMSPEMQLPKLLWLKRHLPRSWSRAARFFDLGDWLTWRASGSDSRSLCTTVCKWGYDGRAGAWDESLLRDAGLAELAADAFARIGPRVLPLGSAAGALSPAAAAELGLPAGIPVATAAIDAHAGGIGTLGAARGGALDDKDLGRRLALIGGTSSCHMAVSPEPRFIAGVWGPYFGAMVPGMWLTEGGQSATGALIDHVLATHPAHTRFAAAGGSVYERINAHLETMAAGQPLARLTRGLHVLPYFHGNRSPRADASLRGAVHGLTLGAGPDDLALLYLATIQAIAAGTRHIIAALNDNGYAIDTILASGGGTRNKVFLAAHADATCCPVVLPEEPEAVLLGAAVLATAAAGLHADVRAAMAAMTRPGRVITPDPGLAGYYARRQQVFLRMGEDQLAYRAIMNGSGPA